MGLCDIEADALSEIYEKAEEKPKSITVVTQNFDQTAFFLYCHFTRS